MASSYPIHKVLSIGKKGMMVSVRFGDKTVTRHLINMRGRHPDDSIPALHDRLNDIVNKLQEELGQLVKGIEKAEKEVTKDGPSADAARMLLPVARIAQVLREAQLKDAISVRDQEAIENPIFVGYRETEQ